MDTTRIRISKTLGSLLAKKIIPVVGGFSGAVQHATITTFCNLASYFPAHFLVSFLHYIPLFFFPSFFEHSFGHFMGGDPEEVSPKQGSCMGIIVIPLWRPKYWTLN